MMRRLSLALGLTGLLVVSCTPRFQEAFLFRWACWLGASCYSVPNSPAYPGLTPTPFPTASPTPTPNPSATPTVTPTATPSPTPTPTPSPTPTPTLPPTTPSFVSSSICSNGLNGGVNIVCTKPSGVVSGNLEVAVLASGGETYTPPSGWTLYGTEPSFSGSNPLLSVFIKVAGGSEPASYTWVSTGGASDAINGELINVTGESTSTPINGLFGEYTTTAAVTIGASGVSIPTVLSTLPIAYNGIEWLAPSNTGIPTLLTGGWTGLQLSVMQDSTNYSNSSNNNGYNALYVATGPLTTSTTAAVTAGWKWGGASSLFFGSSAMLFINPATAPAPTPTPTPSPTPTPGGSCSLPFSAPLNYPDDCYQPYAANSVWNNTIASYGGVTADPNGSTYTSTYQSGSNGGPMFSQGLNFGYANRVNQYQHPIYFGHASDPADTVSAACGWSGCVSAGQTFHIPAYALNAGGTDSHLGVIDESNTTYNELDCWGASQPSGGVISARTCSYQPVTGSGIMYGVTGAGFGLWAGVIRDQELIQGQINHAMFFDVPCSSNASVYPSESRSADAYCANGAPYGGWLRLNYTAFQLATLALTAPAYKMPIYTAAATYGAFQGDDNNTTMYFQTEADEMYTAAGYTNANCPSNGAPCTPLTAWMHQNYSDAGWDGTAYRFNLNDVPSTAWQWLLPPP